MNVKSCPGRRTDGPARGQAGRGNIRVHSRAEAATAAPPADAPSPPGGIGPGGTPTAGLVLGRVIEHRAGRHLVGLTRRVARGTAAAIARGVDALAVGMYPVGCAYNFRRAPDSLRVAAGAGPRRWRPA